MWSIKKRKTNKLYLDNLLFYRKFFSKFSTWKFRRTIPFQVTKIVNNENIKIKKIKGWIMRNNKLMINIIVIINNDYMVGYTWWYSNINCSKNTFLILSFSFRPLQRPHVQQQPNQQHNQIQFQQHQQQQHHHQQQPQLTTQLHQPLLNTQLQQPQQPLLNELNTQLQQPQQQLNLDNTQQIQMHSQVKLCVFIQTNSDKNIIVLKMLLITNLNNKVKFIFIFSRICLQNLKILLQVLF